jgi:hypothetical protein
MLTPTPAAGRVSTPRGLMAQTSAGNVYVNMGVGPAGWDVMSSALPVYVTGTITYTVTDTTP